ncbi:MAG TPA: aldehyde dehydrogenase [Candidatus Poseidoniales archaeon]|nr:MAG: 2-hydroxymuconic semialdehyde dehydrogenase [Euryarchaeota archaeon]HIA89897.1 aldehyde dehydrogenase [Candidatus Poseidoniales archaeon]HIO94327.1 aldehyde dehydrogenase [Candidatus Poseidoniales archaeon]
MEEILNFIGGKFTPCSSGQSIDNLCPATGEVYSKIPRSDATDVDIAVAAAESAQPAWSALSRNERSAWLVRIAEALETRSEEIAVAESRDTGKPISLARAVDSARSVNNFRFFAKMLGERQQETYAMSDATNHVVDKPIGVVGLITPWNLPLYLLSWKIAPALAMGNTVVAKPSELTPMTAHLLCEILADIGLPAGVVNVVHGYGGECGAAIVAHPKVGAISFTGGTATGRVVAASAAPMFKKLSLELGGKNATIILEDADLDLAVAGAARAAFMNQGQVCLCGSRIFIADSIRPEFTRRFVEQVEKMVVGDPSFEDTEFGSLVSHEHRDKVESYIELALREGGTILSGGARPELSARLDSGAFLLPTIIDGLAQDSRCASEEIFGPVVTLHGFSSDAEVIGYANSTEYGLAGSVWTTDLGRGRAMAESIESGMVWVNCWLHRDLRVPFGGTKNSGVGREGGQRSLAFYSEAMNICILDD